MSIDGEITFYEFFEPPLEAGDYAVTAAQTVSGTDAAGIPFSQTYTGGITFAVQGPRFSLPPDATWAVFPPAGAQGEFSNVLPHTVFTVQTLPWQRDPGGPADGRLYPWLAVLTFDQGDPVPPTVAGTIADLQSPPRGTTSYPGLTLEHGESAGDPVLYTDVPAALWTAVAPSLADLRWLASGRVVAGDVLNRKPFAGPPPPEQLSAVVSNRLPAPGSRTVCYLVSLESMAPWLPGGGATPGDFVRLAVLGSWSFGSVEVPVTFADYLNGVSVGTLTVPRGEAAGTGNPTVARALPLGYTAWNHHTRGGAETVSWYRGPLLPYRNPVDIAVPVATADALVGYQPDTGMFDVSLAAAWQLGRLLALADLDFATTLYNWKRTQTQAAVNEVEQEFLADRLGIDFRGPDDRRPPHVQLIERCLKPVLARAAAGASARAGAR